MKLVSYSQLSEKAKQNAIKDYISGWYEGRPEIILDPEEVHELLLDNDDEYFYTMDGDS